MTRSTMGGGLATSLACCAWLGCGDGSSATGQVAKAAARVDGGAGAVYAAKGPLATDTCVVFAGSAACVAPSDGGSPDAGAADALYEVFYPAAIASTSGRAPLLTWGNGTGATPDQYRLATAVAAVRARRSLDELDGWLPASGYGGQPVRLLTISHDGVSPALAGHHLPIGKIHHRGLFAMDVSAGSSPVSTVRRLMESESRPSWHEPP